MLSEIGPTQHLLFNKRKCPVRVSVTLITETTQQGCLLHFWSAHMQWVEGPSAKSSVKEGKRKPPLEWSR